jgi:predicted aspartyl protease
MRALLAVLLGLFFPLGAPAQTSVLARDTEARWVAFGLTPGNQIRFEMSVNGRAATAVLDTGVSNTVVSNGFAAALGLRATPGAGALAVGGRVPLSWASIESLAVAGLTRSGGRIGVADLKAIATGETRPVDVLVGADLLGPHGLEIDYDAKKFRLLPSGRLPFRGTSVPLSLARDSGIYLSEVTIAGQRLRPMIVDTGDGSAITVAQPSWEALRRPALPVTTAFAYGLGGTIETELVVLPSLRIGPLTARNVEVRVEPTGGFSTITGTAGRIGSSFLQRYRVLFDPGARRMVLAPGKRADQMPLRSTSGLLVGLEGTRLRVLHVMRGSPAAGAGWRTGEEICAVDGAAIDPNYLSTPLAAWPADRPGRTVSLKLCGGPERTLTLARFY